ncbi:hypothetical protein HHI36_008018 [Cryptolaemus montrouzieri]|uniref:Uncharacterized protein n=1 Tax=Cryptolaemus montrouzieri TaxID=559131 RepID=A0ABD2MS57_9CUCU
MDMYKYIVGLNLDVMNAANIMKMRKRVMEKQGAYLQHYATNRECPEYLRQLKIREIMAYYNLSLYEANMFCKQPSAPIPSEFTPLNKDGRALTFQKGGNITTTIPSPAPKKLLYSPVTKTPIRQQRSHMNTTSLNSQN